MHNGNDHGTTWWLHRKLYVKLRETLRQITSETMYRTDLRIGEVSYEFVSCFWLISLNSFDFIFLLRDSENDLYEI